MTPTVIAVLVAATLALTAAAAAAAWMRIERGRLPAAAISLPWLRAGGAERAQRRPRYLTLESCSRYAEGWLRIQKVFVDDPRRAVLDAEALIETVVVHRGYPRSLSERLAMLQIHHPRVVEDYRAASDLAERRRGHEPSTEELRQAMMHFRALFADLLETEEIARAKRQGARTSIMRGSPPGV